MINNDLEKTVISFSLYLGVLGLSPSLSVDEARKCYNMFKISHAQSGLSSYTEQLTGNIVPLFTTTEEWTRSQITIVTPWGLPARQGI